ncbi:MAG: c-type cytochrome [Ferrimonas sp.]
MSLSQGKQPTIRKNIVAVQPRPGNVTIASNASENDAEQLAELASASIETLAIDPKATDIGRKLFAANCTVCHGQDGKGMANFPDLTDKEWIYGNSPSDIKATIMHGRNGALGSMPAWDNVLGEDKVQLVSAYVYSLSQL